MIKYIEMTFTIYVSYILSQLCSILHLSLGDGEYHRTILTIKSRTQELTHEFADLFDGEVHYTYDLLADEHLSCVVHCDLGTRLFDPDLRSKIYPDLVCGFPRFWVFLSSDDRTDTEFYGFKF